MRGRSEAKLRSDPFDTGLSCERLSGRDRQGRFLRGGVEAGPGGPDQRGADRDRLGPRRLDPGDLLDAKAYTEARQQHGESELLDEIVAAKPETDRSRAGSPEELKQHNLDNIRQA